MRCSASYARDFHRCFKRGVPAFFFVIASAKLMVRYPTSTGISNQMTLRIADALTMVKAVASPVSSIAAIEKCTSFKSTELLDDSLGQIKMHMSVI